MPRKQKKPHNVSTPNQRIHYKKNLKNPPFTSQKRTSFLLASKRNREKKLVIHFFSSPILHIKTILKLTFKS